MKLKYKGYVWVKSLNIGWRELRVYNSIPELLLKSGEVPTNEIMKVQIMMVKHNV